MEENQAKRLRAARIKSGFSSASEAADSFGWNASGYRHHENGTRIFGTETAQKYSRAFSVTPGWLLAFEGTEVPQDAGERQLLQKWRKIDDTEREVIITMLDAFVR